MLDSCILTIPIWGAIVDSCILTLTISGGVVHSFIPLCGSANLAGAGSDAARGRGWDSLLPHARLLETNQLRGSLLMASLCILSCFMPYISVLTAVDPLAFKSFCNVWGGGDRYILPYSTEVSMFHIITQLLAPSNLCNEMWKPSSKNHNIFPGRKWQTKTAGFI